MLYFTCILLYLSIYYFAYLSCSHQSYAILSFSSSLTYYLSTNLFKLKNNRIGQPKKHTTTTTNHDGTALASSSVFAQDEHQNVAQDSSTIVKGVVSSSASSYNDLFDVGILSKIRSQSNSASTYKQQYKRMTHAARMRLLASDIKLSDSPTAEELSNMSRKIKDLTSSALPIPSLRSGQEGRTLTTVSEEGGGTVSNEEQEYIKVKELEYLIQKLKLLYCAKASKLTTYWHSGVSKFFKKDNDPGSTTTVVSRYSYTQPAPTPAPEIRGRNLQLGGLSQAAVVAYETTFLQELQQNPPAGTTVLSVVITSITEGADGSLSFTFDATSEVDCPAPCDQAQAEAESAAALEDVLAASVSSNGFAAALETNLVNVDCGTTFTCADLQASAESATVAANITSLDVCPSTKVIVCENGNATSVGGVAVASGTTCQDACGGSCCVGSNTTISVNGVDSIIYDQACEGLTEIDGKTCMGKFACLDAIVGSIFLGCYGIDSCAARDSRRVEPTRNGYIGQITNSCLAPGACRYAGGDGGFIDQIVGSCNSDNACFDAAYGDGYIGQITNSCFGEKSCQRAGRYGGYIGQITNSCLQNESCAFAAAGINASGFYGFIGQIVGSCKEFQSCYAAAYEGNITLGIVDSCNATKSCFFASGYYEVGGGGGQDRRYQQCMQL